MSNFNDAFQTAFTEDTQKYFVHSVPKCNTKKKKRFSMTFRYFPT